MQRVPARHPLHGGDGVGGYLSIYLNEFTKHCIEVANAVRRNSKTILHIDACSHIVTTSQQINYTLVCICLWTIFTWAVNKCTLEITRAAI